MAPEKIELAIDTAATESVMRVQRKSEIARVKSRPWGTELDAMNDYAALSNPELAALSKPDLAQMFEQAIEDSVPAWNTFIDVNSAPVIVGDTLFDLPLVMKYVPANRAREYLPARGQSAFDTPSEILRLGAQSPTPNYFIGDKFYTWGNAVYVAGINEPLSPAIYGRVGLVAQLDLTSTWKAFDASDPAKAKLYLEWLRRQDTYPTAALTFDTGHWLNELRNDFRTEFKIDVVLCKPDEEDADKWYTVQTDTWLCVSDFEPDTNKPAAGAVKQAAGRSKRFCDVRLVIVGEEEFAIPVNPSGPPRPPAPPPARAAQLAVSRQAPTAPQKLDIADAYWRGKIVRVPS